jgi:hypothetical protein
MFLLEVEDYICRCCTRSCINSIVLIVHGRQGGRVGVP